MKQQQQHFVCGISESEFLQTLNYPAVYFLL